MDSTNIQATWLNYPLKCHAHWIPWYTAVQDYALSNGVWKYTNPDEQPATPPQEPIKPQISDVVKRPSNTFTSDEQPTRLIDLTPDQLSIYKILLSEYESSKSDYLRYMRAIELLKQGIRSSLTPEGRQIVNGLSPREAIIKLRATFALSSQSKNRQILRDWDALKRQTPPTKPSNLATWCQKWVICQADGEQANIAQFQDPLSPIYDFLEAIQPCDQSFYTFWHNTILQGIKQPTLTELVNQFIDQYRSAPPSTSGSKRQIAHTTYQGRNPDDDDDSNEKPPKPRRKGTCPCQGPPNDGNHDFNRCPYINPRARPKGWQPDEEIQQTFQRICESSPAFKTAYDLAVKRHQKPAKSGNQKRTRELEQAPPDEEMTTRDAFSAYIPKQQAEDLFRADDGKAMSTIWIPAKKNDTWCYDTGASIHVTNNRDLLSNYRPVVSSVMVGNTETTILGYGELILKPTQSLNRTSFPLKHVAYCPGFYINLISAERAASAGIYLNGKDYTLEEKDGTPICRLNAKSGIYLIKWDEMSTTGHSANHVSLPLPISQLSLTSDSLGDDIAS